MKRLSKIFVLTIMALMLTAQIASAKSVDVTAEYEKTVHETLQHFDFYLGLSCFNGKRFKFNDYTRTGMILSSDLFSVYSGTDTITAKKQLKPLLRKYFGTKRIKIHKYKGYYYCPDASWNWVTEDGRIRYVGGDLGPISPEGRVLSVRKKGKKKLIATYQLRWHNYIQNYIEDKELGLFTVTLKKKSGQYIISKIKRTRTSNYDF